MISKLDPLARFELEHDEALAALDRLEVAAAALEKGNASETHLATVVEVRDFLTSAVREHNENEEKVLFPLLEDAPTHQFVEEHNTLRSLEQQLTGALERGAVDEVRSVAVSIVDLLRAHIQRENEVLFPMARQVLGPEGLAEVANRL